MRSRDLLAESFLAVGSTLVWLLIFLAALKLLLLAVSFGLVALGSMPLEFLLFNIIVTICFIG